MLRFAHPLWLFALALLPLMALMLLQRAYADRRDLEGFAQRGALVKMGLWPGSGKGWRARLSHWRNGCLLVALAAGPEHALDLVAPGDDLPGPAPGEVEGVAAFRAVALEPAGRAVGSAASDRGRAGGVGAVAVRFARRRVRIEIVLHGSSLAASFDRVDSCESNAFFMAASERCKSTSNVAGVTSSSRATSSRGRSSSTRKRIAFA